MLKRKRVTIGLVFCCLLLCSCKSHKTNSENKASSSSEKLEYQVVDSSEGDYGYYVSEFEEVNIDQINQKLKNGDQFILYVGEGTCEYCNEFVPKLFQAAKDANIKIFYWDVENINSQQSEVVQFSRKYSIEYVPSLIKYFDEDHFEVFESQGDDETAEDIQKFIETAK